VLRAEVFSKTIQKKSFLSLKEEEKRLNVQQIIGFCPGTYPQFKSIIR